MGNFFKDKCPDDKKETLQQIIENAWDNRELLKENNTSIISFARFKVGEGIEVEVKDFAAEVAEQLQQ